MPVHTERGRRTSVYLDDYRHVNPIPAACRIDNVIYSGSIHGIDPTRDTPTPLVEQAELMFSRLQDIAEAAGATVADVVKVTMRMSDRSDRESVNRVWIQMFPDAADRPARQTVNAQLDNGKLIECDFVAVGASDAPAGHRS